MLRTFTQRGQAYGSVPTSIVAKIDNVVVFSGAVDTVNAPMPPLPNDELDVGTNLFTWQKPVDFSGTSELEITVAGSPLLLTTTVADYVNAADSSVTGGFYSIEIDGVKYGDPFTDEKINGVVQAGPYNPELPGQWFWKIQPGSTFTTTVNVNAGIQPIPTSAP